MHAVTDHGIATGRARTACCDYNGLAYDGRTGKVVDLGAHHQLERVVVNNLLEVSGIWSFCEPGEVVPSDSGALTGLLHSNPDAPAGLAVQGCASAVTVTWTDEAFDGNDAITKYEVLRDGQVIGSVNGTTYSFVDTTAVAGEATSYWVRARNAHGASAWRDAVVFTLSAC